MILLNLETTSIISQWWPNFLAFLRHCLNCDSRITIHLLIQPANHHPSMNLFIILFVYLSIILSNSSIFFYQFNINLSITLIHFSHLYIIQPPCLFTYHLTTQNQSNIPHLVIVHLSTNPLDSPMLHVLTHSIHHLHPSTHLSIYLSIHPSLLPSILGVWRGVIGWVMQTLIRYSPCLRGTIHGETYSYTSWVKGDGSIQRGNIHHCRDASQKRDIWGLMDGYDTVSSQGHPENTACRPNGNCSLFGEGYECELRSILSPSTLIWTLSL